jgi:hypothetical protein
VMESPAPGGIEPWTETRSWKKSAVLESSSWSKQVATLTASLTCSSDRKEPASAPLFHGRQKSQRASRRRRREMRAIRSHTMFETMLLSGAPLRE